MIESCRLAVTAERPGYAKLVVFACAFVSFILVNIATIVGWFGWPSNPDISAKYPTPLTPAGWTFTIWSPIFILQGCGVIYSFLPCGYHTDNVKEKSFESQAWKWIAGWILAICWQLFFMRESMILGGFALLLVAIAMNAAATEGRKVSCQTKASALFFSAPSSLYGGWNTLATGVQVLVALYSLGVSQETLVRVSLALIAVVICLGFSKAYWYKDYLFATALAWGFAGVASAKTDSLITSVTMFSSIFMLGVSLVTCFRTFFGEKRATISDVKAEALPLLSDEHNRE